MRSGGGIARLTTPYSPSLRDTLFASAWVFGRCYDQTFVGHNHEVRISYLTEDSAK